MSEQAGFFVYQEDGVTKIRDADGNVFVPDTPTQPTPPEQPAEPTPPRDRADVLRSLVEAERIAMNACATALAELAANFEHEGVVYHFEIGATPVVRNGLLDADVGLRVKAR